MLSEEKGLVYPSKSVDTNNLPLITSLIDSVQGKSGVTIIISKSGYSFNSPQIGSDGYREEDFLQKAQDSLHSLQNVTTTPRDELIARGKKLITNEHLGGIGITGRSLASIEPALPGLTNLLETTIGKMVFIGNGLSHEPVMRVVDRIRKGEHIAVPVICDLFDYRLLYQDLQQMKFRFEDENYNPEKVRFPFEKEFSSLSEFVTAADEGNLILSKPYRFGTNSTFPPEVEDADIVISFMGPPIQTLPDQMRIVSPSGFLLIYEKGGIQEFTDIYDVSPLESEDPNPVAFRIQKKQSKS